MAFGSFILCVIYFIYSASFLHFVKYDDCLNFKWFIMPSPHKYFSLVLEYLSLWPDPPFFLILCSKLIKTCLSVESNLDNLLCNLVLLFITIILIYCRYIFVFVLSAYWKITPNFNWCSTILPHLTCISLPLHVI